MFDLDRWQEIAMALRRNKLRAFMTAAGVFWGIFMLIIMVGFGRGFEDGTQKNLMGFATNAVYVWGGSSSIPYRGLQPGRDTKYTNDDIDAIRGLPNVELVAPRNQLGGWRDKNNIEYAGKAGSFGVMGDTPAIEHIESMEVVEGRFINEMDVSGFRKVAVIGPNPREVLFDEDEDPIGKQIKIGGIYFQIVGVFKTLHTGRHGERLGETIFVPFSTFQRAFNQSNRVGWFAITAGPDASAEQLEEDIRALLAGRHNLHPDDSQGIGSFNTAEEFEKFAGVLSGINILSWLVGILTLLAGVIGVSNIMLIVVRERTKEIGIRKAVGATPRSIVALVVQESVALTALAGYAGLLLGVGVVEGFAILMKGKMIGEGAFAPPHIDIQIAVIALLILILGGVLAGIIPARHAARIDPIQALRAEA